MMLEAEGLPAIDNPTESEVRDTILGLRRIGPSFVNLTDEQGNYIQSAGSRPWCLVERRRSKPASHSRAYQHTPIPKYKDGAKIHTGAGDITMKSDEWFLLKDAAEIFVAFLNRKEFPSRVMWRSMDEVLRL